MNIIPITIMFIMFALSFPRITYGCDWEVLITDKRSNEIKHYVPSNSPGTRVQLPVSASDFGVCLFELEADQVALSPAEHKALPVAERVVSFCSMDDKYVISVTAAYAITKDKHVIYRPSQFSISRLANQDLLYDVTIRCRGML